MTSLVSHGKLPKLICQGNKRQCDKCWHFKFNRQNPPTNWRHKRTWCWHYV